jgi:hypothetical protein
MAPRQAPAATPAPLAPTATPHETAAGVEVAPTEPVSDQEAANRGAEAVLREFAQGSPAGHVKEHDAQTGSVTTQGPQIPQEIKDRIAKAQEDQKATAVQAGEDEATRHFQASVQADIEHGDLVKERADKAAQAKAGNEHVQRLDTEYEQLVKDTAVQPGSYWSSKDIGHGILSAVGAIMFGLGHDPEGVNRVIERDYAQRNLNRDKQLSATRQRIEDFKSRMLSPEAAEQMDRSLALQAAAAETRRLAEAAAAPEARTRGFALAAQLDAQGAALAAEMAKGEGVTAQTHFQHVQAHGTGGRPNLAQTYAFGRKLGFTTEQIARIVGGGKYVTDAETPEEGKRRVTLPDGTPGYVANEAEQGKVQGVMMELSGLKNDYARIRQLASTFGHTLAGGDRSRLEAVIASTRERLTSIARAKGANARMAGEAAQALGALTGEATLSRITSDPSALAQLSEAERLADEQIDGYKRILTPHPKSAPVRGKMPSLAATEQKAGFEEGK